MLRQLLLGRTKSLSICICAIIKNELKFIKEWLDWHLNLGVTDIYLYEDVNSLPHYYNDSRVHILPLNEILNPREVSSRYRQLLLYNNFFLKFLKTYDWIGFLDLDEFIELKEGLSLSTYLAQHSCDRSVLMYWKCFGANGYIDRPEGNVLDNYKSDKYFITPDYGKSKFFLNTRFRTLFASHHYIKNGITGDNKVAVTNAEEFITFNNIWINHYFTKSLEDWVWRFTDRGDVIEGNRKFDEFYYYNPDITKELVLLYLQEHNIKYDSSLLHSHWGL